MHVMHVMHLLGFSIQRLWGKSLEISTNFSMGLLFSKFDWWVPMTWGYKPYLILGSNTYFFRGDIDFCYCKLLTMPDFLQNCMGTIPNEAMLLFCGWDSGLHVFLPQEQIYGFK